MKSRRCLATASFITLTMLAGCGGGDDPPAADSPGTSSTSAEVTPSPSDAPAGTEAGSGSGDAPATTRAASSGGLGMGAETWAKQLRVALQADDYTVDGNTVTLLLGDATTADSETDCSVAAATAANNVAVVLSYPDGDVAC